MTPLAARYTGRHVRQARHGAWVNKKRTRLRRPSAQLLPTAAAITVAGFLVGGASATIGLSPASSPAELPGYDPADIPPADPHAAADAAEDAEIAAAAARAALAAAEVETQPTVVDSGSCEASYISAGGRTASGESCDPDELTAGHDSLPFDTLVRVTNRANGASVVVRINDRGPSYGDRCLNLSAGAFASIADPAAGVIDVRYEILAEDAT